MDHAQEDDCMLDLRLSRSLEQDLKAVHDFVISLRESKGDVDGALLKKTQAIIEMYQELGQLLEPHLEGILGPLMETLQDIIAEAGSVANVNLNAVKKICSLVHTLMTVCGYKIVVKFFPHQACDLEVTVTLLERCHQEVTVSSILKEESTGDWETQCTLLLWLSILVLIPFDMASVDTALADSGPSCGNSPEAVPPLVERMIRMCKEDLANPGPVREMAGVLLARLLSRPDMRAALNNFVAWTIEALNSDEDVRASSFLVPGVVGVLAALFKVGGRDILLSITPAVWRVVSQLINSSIASRSPLLRKLLVKLTQRVGLVHLPPRVASWRYKQIGQSLAQNLAQPVEGGHNVLPKGSETMHLQQSQNLIEDATDEPTEEDLDVPPLVEEVIEQLLGGLRDKVTVVRWSAAKGVGRVTGRLSLALADEVLASVLELFQAAEGDGAWHGGCLALAELARRGLLLPERLSTVVPVVIKALHYDVRRGPHSVGSHVRDAAAYVTWAFARAYSSVLLKEHLKQIAPALLTIACYDREVNCRRAAAAAFQESVGRQGDFEHGIDIVNAADYFSLGTRSHAYRIVAVYIAQFEEYRMPLIDELLKSKVSHWEKAVRELTAEALSLLVKYDAAYFEGPVLDILVPWTLSSDLGQRHGATLATAEIIRALHQCGFPLTAGKAKSIAGVVPAIEKARLYRGKGGEIMRAAVSRLIECTAIVRVPLYHKVQKVLHDSIDDNLKHPNASIQACAVAALRAFVQAYLLPVSEPSVTRTTLKYLQIVKTYNPAAQRGAALALGALPNDLLAPVWKDVVDTLCSALALKGNPAVDDAETRVNAVRGLTIVCNTISSAATTTQTEFEDQILAIKGQVMSAFFKALNDYAIDNRGDVGSWVREAAMEGIEKCTNILCQLPTNLDQSLTEGQDIKALSGSGLRCIPAVFDKEIGTQVIGGIAKQAVEKIDRVRDVAGRTLQRLLHKCTVPVTLIPHLEELKEIIEDDVIINWAAPGDSFPRLVKFLRFPEYRTFILSGLLISIGGLADSLGKVSSAALMEFFKDTYDQKLSPDSGEPHYLDWLGGELSGILADYAGNDRVVVPALKTIDVLFSRGIFSISQPPSDKSAGEVLSSIENELLGCKDVAKLLAGVTVLSHFATLQGPSRTQSVAQLLTLLFHRYPKVRKFCAEQLYLLLLQTGEELVGSDSTEKALELIGETCWDGQVEGISVHKDQLYTLFHLDSTSRQPHFAPKERATGKIKTLIDENNNYAALVDAAGY
ncbi:unnamed protein product [Calypogeia fissa]